MRKGLLFVGAAALMAVMAVVAGGYSTQVRADGDPPECGPVPIGGTCGCSTTIYWNVACLKEGGGSGHPHITTCTVCPPCNGICDLNDCRTHTTVTCQ